MKKQFSTSFEELLSIENILDAWREFVIDKRKRKDVCQYSMKLMDNIVSLHLALANKTYYHGGYEAFNICDPKPRNIHKASVNDRLLHHTVYRHLYPFFNNAFIADSFSCRLEKGVHKAVNRFRTFFLKVSKNNTRTCWVLKCDIKKFFANVDHKILKEILRSYISDNNILSLLDDIIDSFCCRPGVGLPLGNLTSQLFVNIYMNELDQFMKHKAKARYYIRYCDDFVILSENRDWLESLKLIIRSFLDARLKLELHPNKIFIKTVSSGVDFLGWVSFTNHRLPRTKTKRRIIKRIRKNPKPATLNSYLGLLKHGNTDKLKKSVLNEYYLYQPE